MSHNTPPLEKTKNGLPRPRWLYRRSFAIGIGLLFFSIVLIMRYPIYVRPAVIDYPMLITTAAASLVIFYLNRIGQRFHRWYKLLAPLQLLLLALLAGALLTLVINSPFDYTEFRKITCEEPVSESILLRATYYWIGNIYNDRSEDAGFCGYCNQQTIYTVSRDNGQTWSDIGTYRQSSCYEGEFSPEVHILDEQTFWMWFYTGVAFTNDGGQTWQLWDDGAVPEAWREIIGTRYS